MINETNVKCFLSLAETLNFTETAKRLFMTQQGVSKHISQLEDDLGVPLFRRTHHFVLLTKAGRDCYEMFSDFIRVFNDTIEKTKEYYSDLYKSLHFGYLEWLHIPAPINRVLGLLKKDIPDIKFLGERYPQYELNRSLLDKKVDMIITYESFSPKVNGLKRVEILKTRSVLLVSSNNPRASSTASFHMFRNDPFVVAAQGAETLTETKRRARKQCRKLGFNPSEIFVTANIESAYTAVELGQGVLVSTELSRMSGNGALGSYPLETKENLVCVWHESEENPLVAKFASYLCGAFDGASF